MSNSHASKAIQPSLFEPQDGGAVLEREGDKPHIARVLVEETALELDYIIPEELAHRVHLGSRVHVPLQGRRAIAVVVQLLHESPHAGRLRPIADTIGTKAMFPENLLKLARWLSAYYLSPVRQ